MLRPFRTKRCLIIEPRSSPGATAKWKVITFVAHHILAFTDAIKFLTRISAQFEGVHAFSLSLATGRKGMQGVRRRLSTAGDLSGFQVLSGLCGLELVGNKLSSFDQKDGELDWTRMY